MPKVLKVGSDFSGVGAFDQALRRNKIKYETVFSCDMDKFARQTYIQNYGEPGYYPENVYNREIPKESLDIYMTSPPCQSFSFAGKKKGEDSKNGILFYNSHDFIIQNNPRYFIFENVKGLLSDNKGRTFQNWVDMLGGKSVNGNPMIFPIEAAAPYHVYYKVLNAKKYGVPQNRERVFIIGIRDDSDNNFNWPKEEPLTKRLKDIRQNEVPEKYFLSPKMLAGFVTRKDKNFGAAACFNPTEGKGVSNCVTTRPGSRAEGNFIKEGYITQDTQASQVFSENGTAPTLSAGTHGYANGYVKTQDLQVLQMNGSTESGGQQPYQQNRVFDEKGISPAILANLGGERMHNIYNKTNIRRLTPRECFRLMDFPESFDFSVVSDTQAYKQAGNSIVVAVLAAIINKLVNK